MLGSRLLGPHFGSAVDVWACLISTFLLAFSVGSMVGGVISNLTASARLRSQIACAVVAVVSIAITTYWGKAMLDKIEVAFETVLAGALTSCLALFLLPVTALSTFSPQCVQALAQRGVAPGKASGLIYGVSTLGNIAGVMLTTFVLIPKFPVSTLLYVWLGVAVLSLAALLQFLRTPAGRAPLSPS